jgi:hypothetical protein
MPKKKEEVFDVVEAPTQEPIKKKRKRKPMTDEQKKAFAQKMKEAKAKRHKH